MLQSSRSQISNALRACATRLSQDSHLQWAQKAEVQAWVDRVEHSISEQKTHRSEAWPSHVPSSPGSPGGGAQTWPNQRRLPRSHLGSSRSWFKMTQHQFQTPQGP